MFCALTVTRSFGVAAISKIGFRRRLQLAHLPPSPSLPFFIVAGWHFGFAQAHITARAGLFFLPRNNAITLTLILAPTATQLRSSSRSASKPRLSGNASLRFADKNICRYYSMA